MDMFVSLVPSEGGSGVMIYGADLSGVVSHNYNTRMHDITMEEALIGRQTGARQDGAERIGVQSASRGNGLAERPAKRIVLKLGSRILTEGSTKLSRDRFMQVASAVAAAPDVEIVIVSSGAIAAGFGTLGFSAPPQRIEDRQAAAAVGQTHLMGLWASAFEEVGRNVGQVLLTNDCLADRRRYVTARQALAALLSARIVPIVNENDTVSVDEIMVGDNDSLAATTAALVDADLLVLLTDVAGVYREDPASAPNAEPVAFVRGVDELREFCYRKTAAESIGGMVTKLDAAEKAGRYGIPTVIASGSDSSALTTVLGGGRVGTLIAADSEPLRARKHWMAVQSRLAGSLVVDDGAVRAIQSSASLLPSGIVEVGGRFRSGDLVSVLDQDGIERARGIVRFDDRDVERICGLHSTEVERVLGRRAGNVVMRTDRMFVFERSEDR